jgi:hypothetical protein
MLVAEHHRNFRSESAGYDTYRMGVGGLKESQLPRGR